MSVTEEENTRFLAACKSAAGAARACGGIGTLREKTLHLALKYYMEPLPALHECKIGPYTADIFNENGVIEIQTGSFYPMQKKLQAFLAVTSVEIVHPVFAEKFLVWVDPQTGVSTKPRRSPRRATVYDTARDLFWLRAFLDNPRLRIRLLFLSGVEYRVADGYGRGGKRGSHRAQWEPRALLDEVVLCGRDAYGALLPDLPEPFTTGMLARAIARPRGTARDLLQVLLSIGSITACGRCGREKQYRKAEPQTEPAE